MKHEESKMQRAAIRALDDWFAFVHPGLLIDEQAPVHSNPNEGKRSKILGGLMKQQGLKSGIPDLFLCIPCGGFGGLYIELKTPTGRFLKNQIKWIKFLQKVGYKVVVCRSVQSVIDEVAIYMSNHKGAKNENIN